MDRRRFLGNVLLAALPAATARTGIWERLGLEMPALPGNAIQSDGKPDYLFPRDLPPLEWVSFSARGYSAPVVGMMFDSAHQTDVGLALGGISTGALDLETSGSIGFDTLFKNYPRKPQRFEPFLALSVDHTTWVLASKEIIQGGIKEGSFEPSDNSLLPRIPVPGIRGVEYADKILYFGHYPMVDMEYVTSAPVAVSLRAWSPFIPGDVEASSVPAIVFEVHLHNSTQVAQKGTIALNYPGPQMSQELDSSGQAERIFELGAAPSHGKALPYKTLQTSRPNLQMPIPAPPPGTSSRPVDLYPNALGGKMLVATSSDGSHELLAGFTDKETGGAVLISFRRPALNPGDKQNGSVPYDWEIIDVLPGNGFTALALETNAQSGKRTIVAGTMHGELFAYTRKSSGFQAGNTQPLQNYTRRQRNRPQMTGGFISEICVGDVDGDGESEVVYTTARGPKGGPSPGVYLVRRGATLPLSVNPSADFLGCALGDYNGDGKIEIAVASKSEDEPANCVQIFALDSQGTMEASETALQLESNEGPQWMVGGDFDGNGRADLLMGSLARGTLWIERDTSPIGTKGAWSKPEVAVGNSFAGYSQACKVSAGDKRTYVAVCQRQAYLLGRRNRPQVDGSPQWGLECYVKGPGGQDRLSSTGLTAVALGDLSGNGTPDIVAWQEAPRIALNWSAPGGLLRSTLKDGRFFDVSVPRAKTRRTLASQRSHSVSLEDGAQYALTVLDGENARFGGDLGKEEFGWAKISDTLPIPAHADTGTSAAVDFSLPPNGQSVVRLAFTWYAPHWGESHTYTRKNLVRYGGALDIVRQVASEHAPWSKRIQQWQQAVYSTPYPVWLRDALINSLHLIAEDSYWADCKAPLGNWCFEGGLYGMIESPRASPQIECIPCSWYGDIPVLYFFPELTHSVLTGFKHYQRSDGATAFIFGPGDEMWATHHGYENQIALNGYCFVDLAYRQWLRTGDRDILREFYPAVKAATQFNLKIRPAQYGLIHVPLEGSGTEWWEAERLWYGLTAHAGALNLAGLLMAERMAAETGDHTFARECSEQFELGRKVLEEYLWSGTSYLLYYDPVSGKRGDEILSNQFDAEWVSSYLGLARVFDPARFREGLATIRKSCIVDTGAVAFATRNGTPELEAYGNFIPEMFILAMTYLYAGDRESGLRILQGCFENLYKKQRIPFDWPNHIDCKTGMRTFGTDYYQNMMVWAIPAALDGMDLKAAVAPGSLIGRILEAGRR